MDAIENEIRRNGIDPEDVTVAQLAPVDNYHAFRLAGTLALATAAGIAAADCVLDVGGGIDCRYSAVRERDPGDAVLCALVDRCGSCRPTASRGGLARS